MARRRTHGSEHPKTFRDWLVGGLILLFPLGIALAMLAPLTRELPVFFRLYGKVAQLPPPPTDVLREEPVWGVATFAPPDEPSALGAFCEVIHEHYVSGKNGGWRTDDDWLFRTSAGATFVPGGTFANAKNGGQGAQFPVSVKSGVLEATPYVPIGPEELAEVRRRAPTLKSDGRVRIRCAPPEVPVFVDGCIMQESAAPGSSPLATLGPCAKTESSPAQPLTVTAAPSGEDPRARRLRAAVGLVPGRLAVGFFVLLLPLFAFVRAGSAQGLIEALRVHHGVKETSFAKQILIALGLAFAFAITAANVIDEFTWIATLAALVAPVSYAAFAFWSAQNRRDIEQLAAPTEALATTPLAEAQGAEIEVAAHVASDAPLVASVLGLQMYAFTRVTIWETYQQGKSSVTNVIYCKNSHDTIPLVDRSGRGELLTANCAFDLLSEARASGSKLPETLQHLRIALQPSATYRVREEALLPGEALYLLGGITRAVDASDLATTSGWNYRSAGSHAVLQGTAEKPLFVHAGTESGILDTLARVGRGFRVGTVLFGAGAVLSAAIAGFGFLVGRL